MCGSRISRRVMAEQHLHIANARPGYIGSIATALDVPDAVQFAGQRAVQVRGADVNPGPRGVLHSHIGRTWSITPTGDLHHTLESLNVLQ